MNVKEKGSGFIPDCRHYNADYWNICKGEFFF